VYNELVKIKKSSHQARHQTRYEEEVILKKYSKERL
jgi:hypothetical protein